MALTKLVPLALIAACATAPRTGPLSAPVLMSHVAVLADPGLDGRAAGSPGELRASRYVIDQLRSAGLAPVEQPVPYGGGSVNVHALLAGKTDELVVVGAHLDHLGRRGGKLYPGADDNASGVAAVLGIALALAARRGELERSVLFVFFGAEEVGMVGSRHFVEDPPLPLARVAVMVNVDMIGRPLLDWRRYRPVLWLTGIDRDAAVGLVGTRRFPALRGLADAAFAAAGGEIVAAEDLPDPIGREVERQANGRSDSVAFEDRGIPALFFGDGESRDYHSPRDTIGRLDPAVLERRAGALADVVIALSRAPAPAFVASEATPPRRKPPRGWYLPIGFSNGLSLRPRPGYVIGGELSLVRFWTESLGYAGVYADVLRDTRSDTVRLSFGPELGKRLLGIDAGYVVELDRGSIAHHGAVVRPFVSVSVVSVSARVGYLAGDGLFGELGLAIKFPLPVHTRSRP